MAKGNLRVVAGSVGGRRLVAPRGETTRPTQDRVREAIFSHLGATVIATAVLDLYAGTGAMAIEAMSRGADQALLVEHDRPAVEACRTNLEATGFTDRARVQAGPVTGLVRGQAPREAPFDLVFLDPPYAYDPGELGRVFATLREPGWLSDGARVVWERRSRDAGDAPPIGWLVLWERAYGDTVVQILACGSAAG